jgi:hypothetical protein
MTEEFKMATKKTTEAVVDTAEKIETGEAENVSVTDTADTEKPAEPELVKVKLFKDNRRYKGDVFVSVNGRNYQIQRGVEVEVPAEVAEVLEHSQRQDDLAATKIAEAEEAVASSAEK